MFKFALSAFVCLAFAIPASAQCCQNDCGCDAPKKRIGFVPVQRSLPQISMKCVTDACGCSRRKLSIDRVCVTGAKLGLVDREPCTGGFLKGLLAGRQGRGCGCAAAPVADCGCEAPVADCGCEAPVADCGCEAPAVEDCGCGGAVEAAPMYESVVEPMPVAAPAADCGCNG